MGELLETGSGLKKSERKHRVTKYYKVYVDYASRRSRDVTDQPTCQLILAVLKVLGADEPFRRKEHVFPSVLTSNLKCRCIVGEEATAEAHIKWNPIIIVIFDETVG